MKKPVKLGEIVKYLVSLGLGIGLFWYLYKDQDTDALFAQFEEMDPFWVSVSVAGGLLSHFARGWRWTIMLKPLGHRARPFPAFLAVMSGYMVNMAVPRLGEFVRCGLLKRTDDVPVNQSFGAVVAERAIDLFMLAMLTAAVLLLEFDRIGGYFVAAFESGSGNYGQKFLLLGVSGLIGLGFLFALYRFRTRIMQHFLYRKVLDFVLGIREGLMGIWQLRQLDLVFFVALSVGIWVLYYCMSYFLFFAHPQTADLGALCALTLLVMASVGMALPTPGGTGSYHFFVTLSLTVYGLDAEFSKTFAFFMHTLQTLALIAFGALALALIAIVKERKQPVEPIAQELVNEILPASPPHTHDSSEKG